VTLRAASALGAAVVVVAAAACRETRPKPAPRPSPSSGSNRSVLLVTIDTLRADHLGIYGYSRPTSPRIDALAGQGAVFDHAYTCWPKTRGSMAILLTGRRPSQNGYSKSHPVLMGFNATLASVLKEAGYVTAAAVDNPNVAAANGYAKGFDAYRETWEERGLATETDRARTITETAVGFLKTARRDRPFFLWLHYVSPHAPYSPPPPFDTAFLDAVARGGPRLPTVAGLHGGIPKQWAVRGQDRLGYYVAQYDGEIAAVDQEVGRVMDALRDSGAADRTVVVLTSDHGESLGEHGYYFDHGEDVFEPSLAIPLVIAGPGLPAGRRVSGFASTLDLVATILDAVKVSYPPELAGTSLLPVVRGESPGPDRLFAQNDRNLSATWDRRFKLVATPVGEGRRLALYDRAQDPGETRDQSRSHPDDLRVQTRELDLHQERADREWITTRRLVEGAGGESPMSAEACEKLKALGYADARCPP
jgi:arylsulfatase A-like enzyme